MFGSREQIDLFKTNYYQNVLSKLNIPFEINYPQGRWKDKYDWELFIKLIVSEPYSYYMMPNIHISNQPNDNRKRNIWLFKYKKPKEPWRDLSFEEEIEEELKRMTSFYTYMN